MSKKTKVNLTRGTKLTAEHWNLNKTSIESALNRGLDLENLKNNNGKFSIILNWSRLIAEHFAYHSKHSEIDVYEADNQGIHIPILLPPFQDTWTSTVGMTELPILRSMSVSFDNYMDDVAVFSETVDQLVPDRVAGSADPDNSDVYSMNINIREKEQWYKYGSLTTQKISNIATKSIYKAEIAGIRFAGPEVRFNPYFISGIDKAFHPFKTYLMSIDMPDIYPDLDNDKRWAPPSLTIKLDFEVSLVEKDSYENDAELQNFPTNLQTVIAPVALDTAVADSLISATAGVAANGRVQTNLETVDKLMLDGIASGMDLRSQKALVSRIKEDASYTVIAVPMFNQYLDVRASDINTIGLPYGPLGLVGDDPSYPEGTPTYWDRLYDQRVIKISQPFTIHHILAVHDYGSHTMPSGSGGPNPVRVREGSALVPFSTTFTEEVGVGIASGIRSEGKKYEQVAYMKYVGTQKFDYLVDQIVTGIDAPDYGNMTCNTNAGYKADIEVFQVPLVANVVGGENTRGYYDQGKPYFVGRSDMFTKDRSDVGSVSLGVISPRTAGEETYIDVRWKMMDDRSSGLAFDLTHGEPSGAKNVQYVGTSGCWVYIIGKMPTAK